MNFLIVLEKNKIKVFSILLISLFCVFFANNIILNSVYFMPKEYKRIKNIVNKIASNNNLGNKEISFSITEGSYMTWHTKSLDLCKGDECWYYNNKNPYKNHKDVGGININELSNQAFLYGGIEAYAWNNIVWISKSTFRSLGENNSFLGCIIGHEISHIIFDDHIKDSLLLSSKIKDLGILENNKSSKEEKESEEKKLLQMEISRRRESEADNNSSKLIINSGFPKDTCLKNLTYITKFEKLDTKTDPNSTHPGYLERYSSLEKFIDKYQVNKKLKVHESTKWKWKYNKDLNILTFIPLKKL
jgi:hypothetical protein